MTPRILITGGSGMLGSHIIRQLLQQGYTDITSTYNRHHHHIPNDLIDIIKWQPLQMPNLTETFAIVKDKDWVIHNAGYISYRPRDKQQLLDINQTGTQHVVNACLEEGIQHLVYIGSIASLGKEKDGVTLSESAPWLDTVFSTTYGLSKYLGELEVWRGHGEGLPVSVVLPSVVLGTGHPKSTSWQIIDRMLHKPGYYPAGQTGFVDATDVADFITRLLHQNRSGDRWLLSAANLSYAELYKKISAHLALNKKFRPAPKWMSALYLHGSALLSTDNLGPELLHQTYGTFFYDGMKSLSVDGFAYKHIDESISQMVSDFRAQL